MYNLGYFPLSFYSKFKKVTEVIHLYFLEAKMDLSIESLDRKRIKLLELHLVGFFLFLVFSTTRFFFRKGDLNSMPIGIVVLAGAILGVLIVAFSTLRLGMLHNQIKNNPALKEALYNELVQSIACESWRAAYIGAVASTVFFAIVCFFYPVYDAVLVALNSIVTGAGAYQLYFYVKYKSL